MIDDITFLYNHLKTINVKIMKQQSCIQAHRAQDASSIRSVPAFSFHRCI